jgi:hypothetical protein
LVAGKDSRQVLRAGAQAARLQKGNDGGEMKNTESGNVATVETAAERCVRGDHRGIFKSAKGRKCLLCSATWPNKEQVLPGAPQAAPRRKSEPSMMNRPASTAFISRDGRIA